MLPETTPELPRSAEVAIAFLLSGLFVGLAWTAQGTKSATFDEPMHMLAGQLASEGNYTLNFEHPPLVKRFYGWACRSTGAATHDVTRWRGQTREGWPAAHRYLYHNRIDHQQLLTRARAAGLTLAVGLLAIVWLLARSAFGPLGGLTTLGALCFSPSILAHGPLCNLDLPLVAFLMAMSLCLYHGQRRGDRRWLAAGGLALGAALATKHIAILAIPAVGLWACLSLDRSKRWVGLALIGCCAAAAIVASCGSLEAIRWYLKGLRTYAETGPRQAAYLQGQIIPGGVWYYFLVALGTKLPLSLLLIGLAGMAFGLLSEATRPALLLPALLSTVFLVALSLTGANLGIRYMLILLPALSLGFGCLFAQQTSQPKIRTGLVVLALIWSGIDCWRTWPHYLAYFNLPSRAAGHDGKLLADSNLDWGQDLPALSRLLQQHPADRVYLAYFGTADPLRHGIEAVRLPGFGQFTSPAAAPPKNGERAIVAISTNLLLGLHVAPPGLYSWVWELPQLGRAGKSIHVYDCSGPTARAFLAATFWQVGDWSQLVREMREATTPMRSKIIDVIRTTPQYQRVKGPLLLAEILARAGDLSGAEFELLTAVDVAGQQVEALYKLALLYRQTARRGEAMEAIDRALQLEPSTEQRRLLETLRREMTTG